MRLYALSGRQGSHRAVRAVRDVLSDRLGTEPGVAARDPAGRDCRGQPLAGANRPLPPKARRPSTGTTSPHPRTSFVGRERDLVEVKRALAMTRLLTLTGAGGPARRGLAQEVARDLVGAYPDGVWLVELAALSEPDLVPKAMAGALGVPERPDEPLTETPPRGSQVQGAAPGGGQLRTSGAGRGQPRGRTAGRLSQVAGSRHQPGASERGWRDELARLAPRVPALRRKPTAAELEGSESVRLFVERARHRNPAFVLTPDNAGAVAEVCRELDGLPLAIELAAARVKALSVEQIAARLNDLLRLLSKGNRTAATRHQTMRGALDWSCELLSESERTLFDRLSVFAGGWTLEGAEAVGAGIAYRKRAVLDSLSGLVDKSLVVAETTGSGRALPDAGALRQLAGDLTRALALYEECLRMCREQEDGYWRRHRVPEPRQPRTSSAGIPVGPRSCSPCPAAFQRLGDVDAASGMSRLAGRRRPERRGEGAQGGDAARGRRGGAGGARAPIRPVDRERYERFVALSRRGLNRQELGCDVDGWPAPCR